MDRLLNTISFYVLLMTSINAFGQNDSIKQQKHIDSTQLKNEHNLLIVESIWQPNRKFVDNGIIYKCGFYNKNLINYVKDFQEVQDLFKKGARMEKNSLIPFLIGGACALIITSNNRSSKPIYNIAGGGLFVSGLIISMKFRIKGKQYQKNGVDLYNKK
jgi:hypothetical protein